MTFGAGGDDELVYDLADWDPDQRSRLDAILTAEGVRYRWEGGVVGSSWMAPGPVSGPGSPPQASDQLVVAEGHGDLVEELIDELDHPDALETLDDDGDDAAAQVLSSLYVASDVLVSAPGNVAAAQELEEAFEAAKRLSVPYGLDPSAWDELRRRAGTLAERLGGAGEEAEVAEAARALRTAVRPLV